MPRLVKSRGGGAREAAAAEYLTEACPVANPCEVDLLASLLELDPTRARLLRRASLASARHPRSGIRVLIPHLAPERATYSAVFLEHLECSQ